jgi:hypothetical protein
LVVTFWRAPGSLLWYGHCLDLRARISMIKRSASGDQADRLTCDDVSVALICVIFATL